MNAKQHEAVEKSYLALKVLEHLLRRAGLPMGVKPARDAMQELQQAFPGIEERANRRVQE